MNKPTVVAVVAVCTTLQVSSPNVSYHILHMADALSDGIVMQFANKFA